MKPMRKWLLPALTCLIVVGAAILPPQVSKFRDLRQFGQVHTEALEADDLPVREPATLLDRMALYSGQYSSEHPILSFRDVAYSEEDSEGIELARTTQELLINAGILPEWFSREEPFGMVIISRLLLLDPAEGNAAQEPSAFWDAEWFYDSNKKYQKSVHVVLDAETGLPIDLFVNDTNMSQWLSGETQELRLLAERFFNLLGLEAQEVDSSGAGFVPGQTLSYTIQDSPIGFDVSYGPTVLSIALRFNQWYQGGNGSDSTRGFDG